MNGDTRGGKSVNAGSRIASNRTDDRGSAGGMGGGVVSLGGEIVKPECMGGRIGQLKNEMSGGRDGWMVKPEKVMGCYAHNMPVLSPPLSPPCHSSSLRTWIEIEPYSNANGKQSHNHTGVTIVGPTRNPYE
jgi:hypothetical protein